MIETPVTNSRDNGNCLIAEIILSQLGNQFIMLTGAKDFGFGERSLHFKLPSDDFFVKDGINYVVIELDNNDTYKLTFQNNFDVITVKTGIYNDMLLDIFEDVTGLYTTIHPRK